jgi:hypothetical protein
MLVTLDDLRRIGASGTANSRSPEISSSNGDVKLPLPKKQAFTTEFKELAFGIRRGHPPVGNTIRACITIPVARYDFFGEHQLTQML